MGFLLVGLLLISFEGRSQGYAAYTDYRKYFHVFDHGQFRQLEHLPVKNFKVSKWCVAYIREDGTMMAYHNGQKKQISPIVEEYQVTEGLLVYTFNKNLFVYDGRDKRTLTMDAPYYKADEHIVAYYDRIDKMFKMYYKGEVFDVESALSTPPVSHFDVGDNMLAYQDPYDYLNAYFEGSTQQLMLLQGRPYYKADKNLVAYYDASRSTFNLHHVFGRRELGYFRPLSFKVADNRVVYADNNGNFMVYENDEIRTISTNTPEFYHVHDSILIYEEQNHFKVYYRGEIYNLENFIPSQYKYGYNTLAYLNKRNHLRVFQHGKVKTISYEPVNAFKVYRDLDWFNIGVNTNKIYHKEKLY